MSVQSERRRVESVHLVSRTHAHDAHASVVEIVWVVSHLVALALFSLQLLFLLGLG